MLDLSLLMNKNIVILGAGLTGLSCARFLANNNISFSLNDSREQVISKESFNQQFPNNTLSQGSWNSTLIRHADIILISPGINPLTSEIANAINDECEVFGDVELFCRMTDIPTIAVTGSNGKSTVVSLLSFLGDKLGYNTQLGGNIGVPVLDTVDQTPDFLILELSSFQLETMTNMKALSASVLNLCDDHLDRHLTIDNYKAIKQDIYRQTSIAVINRDDINTHLPEILNDKPIYSFGLSTPHENDETEFGLSELNGKHYLMAGNKVLISLDDLPLSGIHNALNCLAALALGKAAGWSVDGMIQVLPDFVGLAHRCQPVKSTDGILWINDSKATNIGAALAAIEGFSGSKKRTQSLYLIAGGDGKGADFFELAAALNQHVTQLITLGKDGSEIAALKQNSIEVATLNDAVNVIQKIAKQGDIVLLSPACASIDMFENYMARGLAFEQAVQAVQL